MATRICVECGDSFEPTGKPQKYCKSCKVYKRAEQTREYVRAYRSKENKLYADPLKEPKTLSERIAAVQGWTQDYQEVDVYSDSFDGDFYIIDYESICDWLEELEDEED